MDKTEWIIFKNHSIENTVFITTGSCELAESISGVCIWASSWSQSQLVENVQRRASYKDV